MQAQKRMRLALRNVTMMLGLVVWFSAVFSLPEAHAKTIFVKADAVGAATGANWANAFPSLQDGLAAAIASDEIWVAVGTYKPDQGKGITKGDRKASFNLKPNVAVYGGFSGNETVLAGRNFQKNKTILTGDLNGDDRRNFVNYSENSYHVVTFTSSAVTSPYPTAILDGIIITHGNDDIGDNYWGGGLSLIRTSPVIRNCIITDNKGVRGGGITCSGEPQLVNCIVMNNMATNFSIGRGGGIYLAGGTMQLTNCTLMNNTADEAGGIYMVDSSLNIRNSILWGNTASYGPQIIAWTFSVLSRLSIQNSDIQGGQGAIATDIVITYQNNLDVDPRLMVDGHLQAGSPCIDAGSPSTVVNGDIDGETRPYGLGIDIGADEFIDADQDGLADFWELAWFDNLDGKGSDDTDGDGLTNMEEYRLNTNPTNADTDGDGYTDWQEVQNGTDPLDPFYSHRDRLYVNLKAVGKNTGRSWADAFTSLQDALTAALPGYEIWVAAGTYKPDQGFGITPGDHNASFRMQPDIPIYGGFAGTEAALGERDLQKNVTILSGDLIGNDGPGFTNYEENSIRVIDVLSASGATTILDGVTVSHGYHAGISIDGGAAIRNCTISNNKGASFPDVYNEGGGINCYGWGESKITNCMFHDNGGAIHHKSYSLTAEKSVFLNNTAKKGGGINSIFNLFVRDCLFKNNIASYNGGGIHVFNLPRGVINTITIDGSVFEGNTTLDPTYQYSVANGGAIFATGYSVSITNTIIKGNRAANTGGGLWLDSTKTLIANCTITDNSAAIGGGGLLIAQRGITTLSNSILWGNISPLGPQIIFAYPATSLGQELRMNYNDIQGLTTNIINGQYVTITAANNTDRDPLLTADGIHLQPGSPCIDAGDPTTTITTDIDGESRPLGKGFDIGADEFMDTDGDGLPDFWEIQYSLDPLDNGSINVNNGGNGNSDNDGFINLVEYAYNTSPLIPSGQSYYFPSIKDDSTVAWENYLSVQAKDAVPMDVRIRIYDMAGILQGTYIYSNFDPAANEPALAPMARVAQRPSWITGSMITPVPVEGSMIIETSVPAIASTNTIANSYKGFDIYEAAKPRSVHTFGKNYDGPTFYQCSILIQNIYDTPRNVTIKLLGKTATSPGHGVTRTVDIPAYSTYKVRPSELAGDIDFNGSVVVYSNLAAPEDGLGLPIPAMNRFEAGAEALTIYESTVAQPSLAFPHIRDGKFGGALDYQNFLSVVNPSTTANANFTIILYNNSGIEEGRLAYTLPPGGKETWRPGWIKGTMAAPLDFEGSIVVASDIPVVGQTNVLYPGANAYGVDAFNLYESAIPKTSLFFPKTFDNRLADNHMTDNYVYVQNSESTPKTIKIEQFNSDGMPNGVNLVTVGAHATHVYRPYTMVIDGSGTFRGSVKVTETGGRDITGALKYELHQTSLATSKIDCMTIYRSMGQ